MKPQRIALLSLVVLLPLTCWLGSEQASGKTPQDASKTNKFLGRWDLTLKAPAREYPSWLELREENGQLQAQMVGRWGNARPLPQAAISNGHLTFVSPKEEEDSKSDMVFDGTLKGNELSGTVKAPGGTTWS